MEARLRERAGDEVEILGRIPREELYERMARAHCLLVPSVREGWGMVITEANAVGPGGRLRRPRDPGRDPIGPDGALAPTGDAASLGRLAADLVLDRERYERMCAEAVTWGRCFSWDVTAGCSSRSCTTASVERDAWDGGRRCRARCGWLSWSPPVVASRPSSPDVVGACALVPPASGHGGGRDADLVPTRNVHRHR